MLHDRPAVPEHSGADALFVERAHFVAAKPERAIIGGAEKTIFLAFEVLQIIGKGIVDPGLAFFNGDALASHKRFQRGLGFMACSGCMKR